MNFINYEINNLSKKFLKDASSSITKFYLQSDDSTEILVEKLGPTVKGYDEKYLKTTIESLILIYVNNILNSKQSIKVIKGKEFAENIAKLISDFKGLEKQFDELLKCSLLKLNMNENALRMMDILRRREEENKAVKKQIKAKTPDNSMNTLTDLLKKRYNELNARESISTKSISSHMILGELKYLDIRDIRKTMKNHFENKILPTLREVDYFYEVSADLNAETYSELKRSIYL